MVACKRITNAGLAHLSGIKFLDMVGCKLITNAGMVHLRGIDHLFFGDQPHVTGLGLAQLQPPAELVTYSDPDCTDSDEDSGS